MSRPSYEQHRAQKAAVDMMRRRRGSVVESETDLESLASHSTYLSNSSYLSNPPYAPAQRYPSNSQHLFPPPYHSRTFSSTSRDSGSYSPATHSPLSPAPKGDRARLGSPNVDREKARAERAARRAVKQAEKAKKSTLLAEKYDSFLRKWLRWMSRKGWSKASLPVVLALVAVIRVAIEAYTTVPPEVWRTRFQFSPIQRVLNVTIKQLVQFLDTQGLHPSHGYLRRSALVVFAEVTLWTAVILYVTTEAKKSGRSWRTQVTAIFTILLQPSLLMDRVAIPETALSVAALIYFIGSLKSNRDAIAAASFTFAALLDLHAFAYLPVVVAYVLGKAVWLRGFRGLSYLAVVTGAFLAVCAAVSLDSIPRSTKQNLIPIALETFHRTVEATRLCFDFPFAPYRLAAATILVFPSLALILYSSFTLRTTQLQTTKAKAANVTPRTEPTLHTVNLLPLAFLCSALACSIFLPFKNGSITLLPLILIMAMRGGKEGSSASEDEVWQMSCLLTQVAFLPELMSGDMSASFLFNVGLLPMVFWLVLIGYSLIQIDPKWIGTLTYVLHFLNNIGAPHVGLVERFAGPSYVRVVHTYLTPVAFLIAWFWATRKLIQTAWAIGGLG